jgi:tagaturonate reductase
MKRLSYATLNAIGNTEFVLRSAPERVLQFGEGNFLRGFVDYFFDILNEKELFHGKAVVVQPIPEGRSDDLNAQDGLYTLYLRGLADGKPVNSRRLISVISRAIDPYRDFAGFLATAANPDLRFIVSNTTEAGIALDPSCKVDDAPPASFPAKLARLLMERYRLFGKEKGKGFVVLSCELIDDNGKELCRCIEKYVKLWKLSEDFAAWVREENLFCNTLVDRIVTGYPVSEVEKFSRENGYEDTLMDMGESFAFWAIEAPAWLKEELPFERAGFPIRIVEDQNPFKKRKVRILNGIQTGVSLAAYLAGFDLERDYMDDPLIKKFIDRFVYKEILPSTNLPCDDMMKFAASCLDRLKNPWIDHALVDISLNSISKWRARVLPSFKDYYREMGALPPCATFTLSALMAFYTGDVIRNGRLVGKRGGEEYLIADNADVLEFFKIHSIKDTPQDFVLAFLHEVRFWGEDLTAYSSLVKVVADYLETIRFKGIRAGFEKALSS